MKFILPKKDSSLVLYLPLHELDGSSFMSRDAYGHLCTVTGALWTPQGRYFDGIDDRIFCGTDAGMPLGSANRTIMGWFKSNVAGAGNQVLGYGTFLQGKYFVIQVTASIMGIGTHTNNYSGTKTLSTQRWYHFAVMIDGANIKSYLDTQPDINTAHSNLNTTSGGKLYIGWEPNEPAGTTWYGLLGEIYIYNRALTALEIQHNYLATKWRYQ